MSSSADVSPIVILIMLLVLPKAAYSCVVFAYDGIRNGETLTHIGMRRGLIARIYGFFYVLMFIFCIAIIPSFFEMLIEIGKAGILQALLFALSDFSLGIIFIGLAVFVFLLERWIVWLVKRRNLDFSESAKKIYNSVVLWPLAIGVWALIGFPNWVLVCIFAFFIYFSPISSPKVLKKAYSIPSDKVQ